MNPSLRIVTQTPEPASVGYELVPADLRQASDDLTREARALALICSHAASRKLGDVPAVIRNSEAALKRARLAHERSR